MGRISPPPTLPATTVPSSFFSDQATESATLVSTYLVVDPDFEEYFSLALEKKSPLSFTLGEEWNLGPEFKELLGCEPR